MESLRSLWRKVTDRMVGDQLPAESVAAGWALGVFIGCSVPFGFQLVISVPLAMMMRVSKLGATLATFITNPVTIFIIYPVQTYVANLILFGGTLSFSKLYGVTWTWEAVRRLGAEAIASFFLGGFLNAVVLTPLVYFAVLRIVRRRRRRKEGAGTAQVTDEAKSSRRGADPSRKAMAGA